MFGQPRFDLDAAARVVRASFTLNGAGARASAVGYQIYDSETGTFIAEGEWQAAHSGDMTVQVELPRERGHYHVYVSPMDEGQGWFYLLGKPFLLIDAMVEGGRARLLRTGETTVRALRMRSFFAAAGKSFMLPFQSLITHRSLIGSMVRRDIASRYRGSFGDVLWTVLNPVLLMSTYFFVFGIVLESRLGPNSSRSDFVLYLLAGMLPWLAFSEAVGRAPAVLIQHQNFIRKLVFPVEILPVSQTLAGLVTQFFGVAVFLTGLIAIRHSIPVTALWLPVLLIPQLFFTLGVSWFLSALGIFMRDLSQIIGFLLTIWFFLTPICYPETSVPKEAAILYKNPIYILVRGYRAIFLEGSAPEFHSLWKLWLVAGVVFVLGFAWFYKLRKSFADVV